MSVIPFGVFRGMGRLMRSDEAALVEFDPARHVCIFVSHHWWVRPGSNPKTPAGAPDFTEGPRAHMKYRVTCDAVAALIAQEATNPPRHCRARGAHALLARR